MKRRFPLTYKATNVHNKKYMTGGVATTLTQAMVKILTGIRL